MLVVVSCVLIVDCCSALPSPPLPLACIFWGYPACTCISPVSACISPYPWYPAVSLSLYRSISRRFVAESDPLYPIPPYPTASSCIHTTRTYLALLYPAVSSCCAYPAVSYTVSHRLAASKTGYGQKYTHTPRIQLQEMACGVCV